MSLQAINDAALAAAHRLTAQQPQAKFLGNIVGGIGHALAPIAPIIGAIPGGQPFAMGIEGANALNSAMNGGQGGSGGSNPLASLSSILGPAAAMDAVSRGNVGQANALTGQAANQIGGATQGATNNMLSLFRLMQNPALSGAWAPPQITQVGSYAVPGVSGGSSPFSMYGANPTNAPSSLPNILSPAAMNPMTTPQSFAGTGPNGYSTQAYAAALAAGANPQQASQYAGSQGQYLNTPSLAQYITPGESASQAGSWEQQRGFSPTGGTYQPPGTYASAPSMRRAF